MIHHLAPGGVAGIVLANGSLSSKSGGEGEIRKALVEADLVDCIVALPEKLFFGVGIPVSLWFIAKDRAGNGHRDRRGEVLFIDARQLGHMETRTLRNLTDDDTARITGAYHAWRNKDPDPGYEDVPGFAKSASVEEIATHDFVLTPGRYVGMAEAEEDGEPIDKKIARLTSELYAEFERGAELEKVIRERLAGLTDD
jgi:type I restriction enzyme M protein